MTAVWLCSAKSQTLLFCFQNLVLKGLLNVCTQLAAYADYKSAISIVWDALWNIRDSGGYFGKVKNKNSFAADTLNIIRKGIVFEFYLVA